VAVVELLPVPPADPADQVEEPANLVICLPVEPELPAKEIQAELDNLRLLVHTTAVVAVVEQVRRGKPVAAVEPVKAETELQVVLTVRLLHEPAAAEVDVGQEPLLQQVLTDKAEQAVVVRAIRKVGTRVLQILEVAAVALALKDRGRPMTDGVVTVQPD
jgi:hypothetical protein